MAHHKDQREKRVKNQRCVERDDDGTPCYRYVSEEWACIRCGRRACKRHSQSITFSNFSNFSNDGVACLCTTCVQRLGHTTAEQSGSASDLKVLHDQARQAYDELLDVATKRQLCNFRRIAEEALRDPAISTDPFRSKALRAMLALDDKA